MTPRRSTCPNDTEGHVGHTAGLPLVLCRALPFVLACLLGVLLASVGAVAEPGPPEFRGVWITRHDLATPGQVVRSVDEAARLGFNAVMVQVRGRGGALYRSRLVPRSEAVNPDAAGFDPLGLAVREARRLGLEVHAWVNVLLTWHPTRRRPVSPDHPLLQHPEWFMVSADGIDMGRLDLGDIDLIERGVEGRYLSPGVPEVRAYLAEVVSELVQAYDLDGVHLDYIRYPNRHYDHNPAARARFVARFGFRPTDAEPAPRDSAAVVRARLWEAWRAEQVTLTVAAVHDAVAAAKPWVRLSAAVKPDPAAAYRQHGQDWVRWVNGGTLDFVVPMFYVGTAEEVAAQMLTARGLVRAGHLYAGLGAYNQSAAETLSQIASVRELGIPGVVVYSYASLADGTGAGRYLREGPFARAADVPAMSWKPKRGQREAQAR